ncbi:MAG: exo-alpha-sialidase, partial [Treponema sp.]|nr:exo-alpha-sialidase [Treponema sp.]
PVFFAQGDRIDLFYKAGKTIPGWHTRRMRSLDGGRAWTEPTELIPGDVGGRGPVRNKPIRLRSGRVLAPASIETADTWNAFVDISDDGGESFRASPFVPLWRSGGDKPDSTGPEPLEIRGKGVIQPTLWQTEDGAAHMMLRSTEGFILRSDSFDEGESWYKDMLKDLAGAVSRSGRATEINTGAISRHWLTKPYPSEYFLNLLHEAKVPLALTADAHSAENLDTAFDLGRELAKKAGYTEIIYDIDKAGYKFCAL